MQSALSKTNRKLAIGGGRVVRGEAANAYCACLTAARFVLCSLAAAGDTGKSIAGLT
jgi:hypothetical protein